MGTPDPSAGAATPILRGALSVLRRAPRRSRATASCEEAAMIPIPDEVLIDYLSGRLSPGDRADVARRVAADPRAQRRLEQLRLEQGGAPTGAGAAAPRRARHVRSLIVRLRSDSWQHAGGAPGLRSLQAWPRALMLQAGDRELDLQIAPQGEQWLVSGQVLGPEAPGRVLLSGPSDLVATALNELGEFVLPLVAGGRYTLTVTQGDVEIVVPNLEVGPLSSSR
jgi:hypothetical protein